MNAHAKRWVTALTVGPLVIVLVLFGSEFYFAIFMALLIVGAMIEYALMSFGQSARFELGAGIITGLLVIVPAVAGANLYFAAAISGAFILSFLFFLFHRRSGDVDIAYLGKAVLGFIGVPVLLSHLIMIRNLSGGIFWLFFIFTVAVAGDVSAFYVGRTFGRRKLMPHVSPGKTWEGAIGSVLGSLIACSVYKLLVMPHVSIGHAIAMGFAANILGQLGDLSESAVKRSAGAKDSGVLFPGHGGILDRLDVFLFSAPFIYYYNTVILK
jgi:phosphatidate cytidylyltransferase